MTRFTRTCIALVALLAAAGSGAVLATRAAPPDCGCKPCKCEKCLCANPTPKPCCDK